MRSAQVLDGVDLLTVGHSIEARTFLQILLDPVRTSHHVARRRQRTYLAPPHGEDAGVVTTVDQNRRVLHDAVECGLDRVLGQQIPRHFRQGDGELLQTSPGSCDMCHLLVRRSAADAHPPSHFATERPRRAGRAGGGARVRTRLSPPFLVQTAPSPRNRLLRRCDQG